MSGDRLIVAVASIGVVTAGAIGPAIEHAQREMIAAFLSNTNAPRSNNGKVPALVSLNSEGSSAPKMGGRKSR